MKFCLISGEDGEDVKEIFLKEAKKKFDSVLYAPLAKIRIECNNGKTNIFFKDKDLSEFDAAYVRVFEKDFAFAEIILDVLENNNVYMPSLLDGYQITNHKFYTVQRVSNIGVSIPDSSLTINPIDALNISKKMGFPVILKLIRGFGGKGVMKINTEEELTPILDTLKVFNEFLSTQKYIESNGVDYRALIIGKKVIGIKRKSQGSEWRANVSGGGTAKFVKLNADLEKISLDIADLLGLEICAIDFIKSGDQPIFIEANFTPGIMPAFFKGKLAGIMISHIYSMALIESKKLRINHK